MLGQHRLSIPDLIVVPAAEVGGATVLHYDRDNGQIAAVTGQPHECVVVSGSVD